MSINNDTSFLLKRILPFWKPFVCNKKRLILWFFLASFFTGTLFVLNFSPSQAQAGNQGWTTPELLFSGQGDISAPAITADKSGRVHVFWSYTDSRQASGENIQQIYYMQWDGKSWTSPIDVVASSEANFPSASVDSSGNIHLIWFGANGELYYSHADIDQATSARGWSLPIVIDRTNGHGQILADPTSGRIYIVYPGIDNSGPYYSYSDDGGHIWSSPANIASTGSEDAGSDYVYLAVGNNGELHVVWSEFRLPKVWPPTGIYYSQSKDHGKTWSSPVQIDDKNYDQVNLAVLGDKTIYVAYNGMVGVGGRYTRVSNDDGQTWSDSNVVVPPGGGGTTGAPTLVLDSGQNLHLLISDGPKYTAWDGSKWSPPVTVSTTNSSLSGYLEEAVMTVSSGNQLHVIFWDDRKRLWHTMSVVPAMPVPPEQFSVMDSVSTALPSETPAETALATPAVSSTPIWMAGKPGGSGLINQLRPDYGVSIGVLSVVIFLGIFFIARVLRISRT